MWVWAGGAAAAVGFLGYAARGRSSSLLAPSIHRGPRDRRAVALTFDDGPTPSTAAILEVLAQHGARATFFQCGVHARRRPEVVRQVVAAGHEIGNHTDTHSPLWLRSPGFIYEEVARAQEALFQAGGQRPRLFRAPYGVRWPGLARAQKDFGLLGVMWTVIGLDWKLDPQKIAQRVLGGVCNGAIVCLHDGREMDPSPDVSNTIEALRRLLPELLERGYELTTVSDLLCPTS